MTEQEVNNLIDSKIAKTKMSQLPEATQTSGLYSIGYTGNQSVKYKANLLQGDPLTVRKTYQTEALALADKNPIDTTTSLPLTVGQFISIVNDGDKNGIYRISSISGDGTMSLELQGKLGDLSEYAKSGGSSKNLKEIDDEKLDKIYFNDKVSNLFKTDETYLFPEANLTVRRYQSDTTFNDYSAGYSQTALAGGLRVAIPASGSASVKYYLRTGLLKIGILKAHFEFNGSTDMSYFGAGIGYIDASGDFIFYYLSGSGQFRKTVNFTHTVDLTVGITYDNGDSISYSVEDNRIVVTKNGAQIYSHTLDEGEFETEILIGQRGFPQYTVYLQDLSDPIRQYVSSEITPFQSQIDEIEIDLATKIDEEELYAKANELFEVEKTDLFPEANLTVRRYQADTTFNDYAAGYSQTALADGLRVAIPASGSNAITHYLRTGLFKIGILKAHFEFSSAVGYQGAGIGYIDASGNFIFYYLSGSGQFRKTVNFTNTVDLTVGITYDNGDSISYSVEDNRIVVTKNGAQIYSHTLDEGEFETEILIGQLGFPQYTVYLQDLSDPIRQYVSSELANFENLPECFYSYDPLAIESTTAPTNTGMFTVFVRLNGNKYSGFHLGHEVDMGELVYKDYWRIRNASIYEFDGSQMIKTAISSLAWGESECVWKRNSAKDDFTGGYHGDELVTEVLFFANGVQIDPALLSDPIPLTACNDFYYLEKSTMHATAENGIPITGHPIECYHIKKTDFRDKGYETFNELVWIAPGLVTLWYHGICCLSKDIGEIIYSEDFNQIESGGFPETPSYRKVWYRSEMGSAFITSKILKIKSDSTDETNLKDNSAILFVQDRNTDNKYYRKMPATNVLEGDVWQSFMKVKMDLK